MDGLIGKKLGMSQIFTEDGKAVPVTVIEAGPCFVTQVKTMDRDGYAAVQLGFDEKKQKHTTKPLSGHFKKAEVVSRTLENFSALYSGVNVLLIGTISP